MTKYSFREIKCKDCGTFHVEGRQCSNCNDLSGKVYCPVCENTLHPVNHIDVTFGWADSFVYVHDDKPHSDQDLSALERGIQ